MAERATGFGNGRHFLPLMFLMAEDAGGGLGGGVMEVMNGVALLAGGIHCHRSGGGMCRESGEIEGAGR